jgi:hypothetical protein
MRVNLDSGQIRPVLQFESVTQFDMPNGTVTVIIDRPKGLMEIFSEPEPDPVDWELACGLITRMGLSGQLQQGEYLRGVDVFRVQLKARQAPARRARGAYSTRAIGAVAAFALICLPLLAVAHPHVARHTGPARHPQVTMGTPEHPDGPHS